GGALSRMGAARSSCGAVHRWSGIVRTRSLGPLGGRSESRAIPGLRRALRAAARRGNMGESRLPAGIGRGPGECRRAGEAEVAQGRQLEPGLAEIEAGDETQQIDLEAFHPADLDSEEAPQARLDAGAAVGQADKRARPEVLADPRRRQGGGKLGRRAQHGGQKRVAVRTRPYAVNAGPGELLE